MQQKVIEFSCNKCWYNIKLYKAQKSSPQQEKVQIYRENTWDSKIYPKITRGIDESKLGKIFHQAVTTRN